MIEIYTDLIAAVVRQAFNDVKTGESGPGMDARKWLKLAGLMTDDGKLPYGRPIARNDIGAIAPSRRGIPK